MHFAVTACMRNEAMFLLEWIAYQRLIGFRTIIIVTNDCTDGTDEICDQIAAVDPDFVHVRSVLAPGEKPQIRGMEQVFALPVLKEIDYLLHCDADEFIQIDCYDGSLEGLIDTAGRPDCVALVWRPFGDAGLKRWEGGLVTEKCQFAAQRLRPAFLVHKSLFRPRSFGAANAHMPKAPTQARVTVANTLGERMPARSMFNPKHARFRRTPFEAFTWQNAYIRHYAIRSEDTFLMKNLRGDAMLRETDRYCLNSKFWRRNNKNDVLQPLRGDLLQKLKERVADLRRIGSVASIEAQALHDFQQLRKTHLTAERIAELTVS